jgi:small-conductance mechanosensitive channel
MPGHDERWDARPQTWSRSMNAQQEPAAARGHGRLVAIVAIALLAGAVVAGGVTHKIVSSHYGGTIALKNTAIATQQTAIRNSETALTSLRAENTDLRSRLTTAETARASQQTAIQTVDTTVSGLRAEIAGLQSRLAATESARATQQSTIQSLDTALNSLRADNADLRARLAAADAALARGQRPRDPNAIFQMGAEVGRVTGAREDRDARTVTFESIEGGNFDRGQEFEYRDLTLRVTSHKSALTSFTGRGVRTEMTGVQTTIVGVRAGP